MRQVRNQHAAGDGVLIESAAICKSEIRKTDLLGRMGGEELAILLPHTGLAAALKVAEKLRATMADRPLLGRSGSIRFSASFGLAAVDRLDGKRNNAPGPAPPDIETLLRRADDALYDAKAQGRNRCAQWLPLETIDPSIRRRVFKAGQIAFRGGRSTIDCTVRGLSDLGASLGVISTAAVPGRFKLRIDSDHMSRSCRVVVKREKYLEVEFS